MGKGLLPLLLFYCANLYFTHRDLLFPPMHTKNQTLIFRFHYWVIRKNELSGTATRDVILEPFLLG